MEVLRECTGERHRERGNTDFILYDSKTTFTAVITSIIIIIIIVHYIGLHDILSLFEN